MRSLLSRPRTAQRVGRYLLLLQVTGRKTGRVLVFPVAYRRCDGGRLMVLTNSPWRVNLRGGAPVTVTLLGERRAAHMGIRINVPRAPTLDELADAARRDGLAVVYLDVEGPR